MFDGPFNSDRPVQMAARHRAAETQLAAAKQRIAEIRTEIGALNSERTAFNSGAVNQQLQLLDAEEREILDRAGEVRRQLVQLRAKHAAATRASLTPAIIDSARLGADALAVLQTALNELDAVNAQLERAYAEVVFYPRLDLSALAARLTRLAAG
jgi:chromosome segregation ATPase